MPESRDNLTVIPAQAGIQGLGVEVSAWEMPIFIV
jgi:hypothetical protein